MEISNRELEGLLDRVWDKGLAYYVGYWYSRRIQKLRRTKDIGKIIEEFQKAKEASGG